MSVSAISFGLMNQICIDLCQQGAMSGWVSIDGTGADIRVLLNGEMDGVAKVDHPRPDVAAAIGCDPWCGFTYSFSRSVRLSDKVELEAPTGERFPSPPHIERCAMLGYGLSGQGLEIGALDRPFITRPSHDIFYCDHASTEDLLSKYSGEEAAGSLWRAQMVDVSVVWEPGRRLSDCTKKRFDYVVASQAIEHVADPIGWLNQIAECLNAGGRVNLSVPDMRRTFDMFRTLSTAADLVEAFEVSRPMPSFRSVFDHIIHGSLDQTPPVITAARAQEALRVARAAEGRYIDVHVHVWTYESFLQCWEIIEALNICALTLDKSWAPVFNSNEFIVSFKERPGGKAAN